MRTRPRPLRRGRRSQGDRAGNGWGAEQKGRPRYGQLSGECSLCRLDREAVLEVALSVRVGQELAANCSRSAAWEARSDLQRRCELIEKSHFHVMILACPTCAQTFLSVFSELIDWDRGDGSQGWTLLPITAIEDQTLTAAGTAFEERSLYEPDRDRPSLYHTHPKGRSASSFWGRGIPMLPHY